MNIPEWMHIFKPKTVPDTDKCDESKQDSDTRYCLVQIMLNRKKHLFYQDAGFVENLTKAMELPTSGGFFEYQGCNSAYAINLSCVDCVNILEASNKISNGDAPGYTVYLREDGDAIELGDLPVDQVNLNFGASSSQFIRLGSSYFNRDAIALLVCNMAV